MLVRQSHAGLNGSIKGGGGRRNEEADHPEGRPTGLDCVTSAITAES